MDRARARTNEEVFDYFMADRPAHNSPCAICARSVECEPRIIYHMRPCVAQHHINRERCDPCDPIQQNTRAVLITYVCKMFCAPCALGDDTHDTRGRRINRGPSLLVAFFCVVALVDVGSFSFLLNAMINYIYNISQPPMTITRADPHSIYVK